MVANTNHSGGCTDSSPTIDTGASVSMIGRPLYQKIQQVSRLRLQMQDTPQLEGVGGNPVPTLGHTMVGVGIGDGVYKATVGVSVYNRDA